MDRATTAPFWKKTIALLGYAILNTFLGLIVFIIIETNFEASLPKGQASEISIFVLSCLLATPVTLWWRYQIIHKERIVARRKEREAAAHMSPIQHGPDLIERFIAVTFKLVFWVVAVCICLYLAYAVIASLTVPVAIVLGAVIIGVCILSAAAR